MIGRVPLEISNVLLNVFSSVIDLARTAATSSLGMELSVCSTFSSANIFPVACSFVKTTGRTIVYVSPLAFKVHRHHALLRDNGAFLLGLVLDYRNRQSLA